MRRDATNSGTYHFSNSAGVDPGPVWVEGAVATGSKMLAHVFAGSDHDAMTSSATTACAQAAQISINFVNLGAWKIFVLGIVQGITELLPISSTAHLRIVPALLGWPDPGSAFSAAMQLASLVAVLTFLWPDLTRLTGQAAAALTRNNWRDHSLQMAAGILVGTIPIGIAGL